MGKMIVIEGLDGSGKGTQTALLKEALQKKGVECFSISLPNYEDESSTLVKMYLRGEFGTKPSDVNAYAASTFFAVDRIASFKKYWSKEYESGKVIIADRYTTSNACHQMTKLQKGEWDEYLSWLFEFEYKKLQIPSPDRVIFLDMPVEVSQELLKHRYDNDESKKDVHERDVDYLKNCHEAAEYACDKLGWVRVPCAENGKARSIEAIAERVLALAEEVL